MYINILIGFKQFCFVFPLRLIWPWWSPELHSLFCVLRDRLCHSLNQLNYLKAKLAFQWTELIRALLLRLFGFIAITDVLNIWPFNLLTLNVTARNKLEIYVFIFFLCWPNIQDGPQHRTCFLFINTQHNWTETVYECWLYFVFCSSLFWLFFYKHI